MIMYTNTSMVHMGIITHHSPLYEGNDQVAMAIQTFIIPLHSFNTSNDNDCDVVVTKQFLNPRSPAEGIEESIDWQKCSFCQVTFN